MSGGSFDLQSALKTGRAITTSGRRVFGLRETGDGLLMGWMTTSAPPFPYLVIRSRVAYWTMSGKGLVDGVDDLVNAEPEQERGIRFKRRAD